MKRHHILDLSLFQEVLDKLFWFLSFLCFLNFWTNSDSSVGRPLNYPDILEVNWRDDGHVWS